MKSKRNKMNNLNTNNRSIECFQKNLVHRYYCNHAHQEMFDLCVFVVREKLDNLNLFWHMPAFSTDHI